MCSLKMGVKRVVTYEPTCDECFSPADEYMDRKEAVADLKKNGHLHKQGWRKRGKQLLCPDCDKKRNTDIEA